VVGNKPKYFISGFYINPPLECVGGPEFFDNKCNLYTAYVHIPDGPNIGSNQMI